MRTSRKDTVQAYLLRHAALDTKLQEAFRNPMSCPDCRFARDFRGGSIRNQLEAYAGELGVAAGTLEKGLYWPRRDRTEPSCFHLAKTGPARLFGCYWLVHGPRPGREYCGHLAGSVLQRLELLGLPFVRAWPSREDAVAAGEFLPSELPDPGDLVDWLAATTLPEHVFYAGGTYDWSRLCRIGGSFPPWPPLQPVRDREPSQEELVWATVHRVKAVTYPTGAWTGPSCSHCRQPTRPVERTAVVSPDTAFFLAAWGVGCRCQGSGFALYQVEGPHGVPAHLG